MKKIFKKIFGVIVLANIAPVFTGLIFIAFSNETFWDGYIDCVKIMTIVLGISLGIVLTIVVAFVIAWLISSFIDWAFDTNIFSKK